MFFGASKGSLKFVHPSLRSTHRVLLRDFSAMRLARLRQHAGHSSIVSGVLARSATARALRLSTAILTSSRARSESFASPSKRSRRLPLTVDRSLAVMPIVAVVRGVRCRRFQREYSRAKRLARLCRDDRSAITTRNYAVTASSPGPSA
jgi:hypothetical protein